MHLSLKSYFLFTLIFFNMKKISANKLGVFDSGLGGLLIAKSIHHHMPDLDLFYFGDTLHLPYGNRSEDAIEYYTRRAMDAMFEQGCGLIVLACNTASAACLRRLQQNYLPEKWPDRNIIGVVVPTLEESIDTKAKNIGLIATNYVVHSNIFKQELTKLSPDLVLQSIATPLLVPLIENGGGRWLEDVLGSYLQEFDLNNMDHLILGCTHYVRLKPILAKILPSHIKLISQDDIIPRKLEAYLKRHPHYVARMDKGEVEFFVSDLTQNYQASANDLYGYPVDVKVLKT